MMSCILNIRPINYLMYAPTQATIPGKVCHIFNLLGLHWITKIIWEIIFVINVIWKQYLEYLVCIDVLLLMKKHKGMKEA